jgi:hypothetical protein
MLQLNSEKESIITDINEIENKICLHINDSKIKVKIEE